MKALVYQQGYIVVYALSDRNPVQLMQGRSNVLEATKPSHKTGSSVPY